MKMKFGELGNAISMLPGLWVAFQYTILFWNVQEYAIMLSPLIYGVFCITSFAYHIELSIKPNSLILYWDLLSQRICTFLTALFVYKLYMRAYILAFMSFIADFVNLNNQEERKIL